MRDGAPAGGRGGPTAAWLPWLALGLAPLAAAAGLAWLRSPPPPGTRLLAELEVAARRPCSPVEIVGLRGFGDGLDEWSGAGADVHALAEVIRSRLAGRERVELYGLPYEQGPSPFGLPLSVARDVPPAATALARYVRWRRETCPGQRLLVVGQSEGAAVAHWAYPQIADVVAGVVLLGDPLRLARAPYDGSPASGGIGQLAVWLALDPPSLRFRDRIPAAASTARSYCLPHDRVCGLRLFDRHRDTHMDYRRNPPIDRDGRGVLDLAADFAMRRLAPR